MCEEGKKSREYFSGYESVRFTIWRFKPGEDDLLSHVFEVVAKGFDASEWGYGFGRTKIEDARAFFSFSRGISASDRLLEVIVLALTHFATLDAERKKYTEKDIDPAGDYTEPPD